MATYAVGDIQGCLDPLLELLEIVKFRKGKDALWIVGDLVNRGPKSLDALRFASSFPKLKMVLGNHDLHLLAAARGFKTLNPKDTLNDILVAKDRDTLLHWLQNQPLLHHDSQLGYTMVHAGIPPMWSIKEAKARAKEVEKVLQSKRADRFFSQMYGNLPDQWHDRLKGMDRLRLITNYFTRMRFCSAQGQLELKTKSGSDTPPDGFSPWFDHPHRCKHDKILFGHWASLQGYSSKKNFIALDYGCVWGGELTIMRLEDQQAFSLACDCTF